MNSKEYVVRIVKSASKPYLPKVKINQKPKRNPFLSKIFSIVAGSGIGFAAGLAIYLMLKLIGANFGGLESSIIIGLPSFFGILTSLVIF